MTFVQATFVLATFVHISNISEVAGYLDQTLNAGSLDNLKQRPTVMGTFIQATIVLVTFVHISNISAIY